MQSSLNFHNRMSNLDCHSLTKTVLALTVFSCLQTGLNKTPCLSVNLDNHPLLGIKVSNTQACKNLVSFPSTREYTSSTLIVLCIHKLLQYCHLYLFTFSVQPFGTIFPFGSILLEPLINTLSFVFQECYCYCTFSWQF